MRLVSRLSFTLLSLSALTLFCACDEASDELESIEKSNDEGSNDNTSNDEGSSDEGDNQSDLNQPAATCEEGEMLLAEDECNYCLCTEGELSCTRMGCEGALGESDVEADTGESVCDEGESTTIECNSCICAGGDWACTKRACSTPLPATCEEGETQQVKCNTCSCAGGAWICTEKACTADAVNTCGGSLGDTCAAGEYCTYEASQCGSDDAAGRCEMRPDLCTADYEPVCGCDEKTYSNACSAAAAGISVLRKGACD